MHLKKVLTINLVLTSIIIIYIVLSNIIKPSEKIGYINSYKVIKSYKGTKKATQQLMQKTAQWQPNIDTLKSELQAMIVKYKRDSIKLGKQQRASMRKKIIEKQHEFKNYQQAISKKIENEDKKYTEKIYNEIDNIIKEYAVEHGYSLILGAKPNGSVVYGKNNITEEIIEYLNNK